MSFNTSPFLELNIGEVVYRFSEHPNAHGVAYGQEGRRGIVYQLISEDGNLQALKVFKPRFRVPRMVAVAEKLVPYATLPGLQACQRIVLTGSRHPDLLSIYPDLTYAVLMPWVEGSTWQEILTSRIVFDQDRSLIAAHSLAQVLMTMEEQGLAHCDLSGPNLILSPENKAALVDLEEMYGPSFLQPEALPSGSSGYAHRSAPGGLWNSQADRFAGALLLGEMLGWCDERVREAAWGESYFPPTELQKDSKRYSILLKTLETCWGKRTKELFIQTWCSDSLLDCPTFAEWNIALRQVGVKRVLVKDEGGTIDKNNIVSQESKSLIGNKSELITQETWTCPHCGKVVLERKDVCPYCENSREAIIAPQFRTQRRIPFWGWIAGGVVILSLLFAGDKIISLLFQATPTPTPSKTQIPTVIPTQTQAPPLTPTITQTLSPTSSPTPEPSETLKPTLVSSDIPTPLPEAVVSAENANIRSGPGIVYPVVRTVTKGDNLPIIGRSQDSSWLVMTLPDGQQGWVALSVIETTGLIEGLPVIAAPPTPIPPTFTPVPPKLIAIYPIGDLNRDCIVDRKDMDIMLACYTDFVVVPGDPTWNRVCDINGDGKITIDDASLLSQHYRVTPEVCQYITQVVTQGH